MFPDKRPSYDDGYPQKIFASQLITVEHLLQFKKEFFDELRAVLKAQSMIVPKKWLKAHEVRRMLRISPGTLQTLKASGTLPFTKVGGIHFFDHDDVQRMLEEGKVAH